MHITERLVDLERLASQLCLPTEHQWLAMASAGPPTSWEEAVAEYVVGMMA
jgi:hypothetical protein